MPSNSGLYLSGSHYTVLHNPFHRRLHWSLTYLYSDLAPTSPEAFGAPPDAMLLFLYGSPVPFHSACYSECFAVPGKCFAGTAWASSSGAYSLQHLQFSASWPATGMKPVPVPHTRTFFISERGVLTGRRTHPSMSPAPNMLRSARPSTTCSCGPPR